MEKYAGARYAPFGGPSAAGQVSVLSRQSTPLSTNPTMVPGSDYVPWQKVDWKAVIAKNTLYTDRIGPVYSSTPPPGATVSEMSSSARHASPRVNQQSTAPIKYEETNVSISMSPSPEPEIAQSVKEDPDGAGPWVGSQQEPISISESPSPRASPEFTSQLEQGDGLESGTSQGIGQQIVDTRAIAPPPSPLVPTRSLQQAVKHHRNTSSSGALPKVMPPLRYSTTIGIVPMSDGQSAVKSPSIPIENEPLSNKSSAELSGKNGIWPRESLHLLAGNERGIFGKNPEYDRDSTTTCGKASDKNAWTGPLITLGSLSRTDEGRRLSKRKQRGDNSYDTEDETQHSDSLDGRQTRSSKRKKIPERPVRKTTRPKQSPGEVDKINRMIEYDPFTTVGRTRDGRVYPRFHLEPQDASRQHKPQNEGATAFQAEEKQSKQQASLNLSADADESLEVSSSMNPMESAKALQGPAMSPLSQVRLAQKENLEIFFERAAGRATLFEVERAIRTDRLICKTEQTILSINKKASQKAPLPSAPVSESTETPVSNIRLPGFKKVQEKGFIKLVEIGYVDFALATYDLNKKSRRYLTVEELETAWRIFASSEFQKWHAGEMEHDKDWKLGKLKEALLQIEEQKEKLLKGIARRQRKKSEGSKLQLEAIEGTLRLVEAQDVSDEVGGLNCDSSIEGNNQAATAPYAHTKSAETAKLRLEGYVGHFAGKSRKAAQPPVTKSTQLWNASNWYWGADGNPVEGPKHINTNGTIVNFDTQVKSETAFGRDSFDNDLYDLSEDEGAKRGAPRQKLSHPSKTEVIDLTQDDGPIDLTIETPNEEEEEGADYFMNAG